MAHFAELDSNNIIIRVVVVGNDITTAAGPLGENDMHVDGETWCVNFFKGGNWKQTSYNNNFRKQYCGTGFTFDAAKDKFISPQPYTSWALDGNDDWQAPVTYPNTIIYNDIEIGTFWDESGQVWMGVDDNNNEYNWDHSNLVWIPS